MTKISVILPTNRINNNELLDAFYNIHNNIKPNTFNDEFYGLVNRYCNNIIHYLQPTLDCLSEQTFKDFEVLICNRHPDDISKHMQEYYQDKNQLGGKLKIIKEKPSIWHKLGDYPTISNARNTGIIYANGELLLFLDDMTIFNNNLLSSIWNNYKKGFYTTCKSIRRIQMENNTIQHKKGKSKKPIFSNKIFGIENLIQYNIADVVSNYATWTYGCSVSLNECLRINGFDEIYDGNIDGEDIDFGLRLSKITKYKRVVGNYIYEFNHGGRKQKIRDDMKFREIIGQYPEPRNVVANSWKPSDRHMRIYKNWHIKNIGELDKNWNVFMKNNNFSISNVRKQNKGTL